MRKETEGQRLTNENIFSLDRSNQSYNLEKGFSASVGFDYELTKKINNLFFLLAKLSRIKRITIWQLVQVYKKNFQIWLVHLI